MVIVLFLKKWQLAVLFPWIPLSDEHLNILVSWNVKIQNSRGKINPCVLKLDLFEFFRHKNCSFKDWVETVYLLLSSIAPYAPITKLNYPFRFVGCFDRHLKEALKGCNKTKYATDTIIHYSLVPSLQTYFLDWGKLLVVVYFFCIFMDATFDFICWERLRESRSNNPWVEHLNHGCYLNRTIDTCN